MPKRSDDVAEAQRAYLKRAVELSRKTITRIATDCGMAPSTLTRFLNKRPGAPRTLHAETISRVEEVTGVPWGGAGVPSVTARRPRGLRGEGIPFRGSSSPAFDRAVEALVETQPGAEPWTINTRALDLRGFVAGDTVIVAIGKMPAAGDLVCAQVLDGARPETVFRVYEPPYLVAASSDASVQKPLVVDNDRVVILGVLLPHRLQRPADAA